MEGFLQETLGKALISLPPKGCLKLPLHPASWGSLLPLTGGWKVAHTQKVPLLGSATEPAWDTPKESLITKQKRKKKAIWNLPKLFFNNSKVCLELFPRPDWSKNNTTFFPSDWFRNGMWLLPASRMWREVLMERFEEVYASKTESQEVIDSLLLETTVTCGWTTILLSSSSEGCREINET